MNTMTAIGLSPCSKPSLHRLREALAMLVGDPGGIHFAVEADDCVDVAIRAERGFATRPLVNPFGDSGWSELLQAVQADRNPTVAEGLSIE
ncbi:hypothetical protein [Dokdonella sp.]|uniref:hypothetical protein n=1 Tax=Dokdonella sp. TaxID=2291710 RepID=UPI00378526E6